MKFFALLLFASINVFAQIPMTGKKHIEYRKVKYKIYKSLGTEYEKLSKDNPALKEKVLFLINGFAELQSLTGKMPTYDNLAQKAKEILKEKPKDPLAKSLLGNIILYGGNNRQDDFDKAFSLLDQGSTALSSSTYSLFAKMLSSFWLRKTVYRSQKINGKKEKQIMQQYTSTMLAYTSSETTEDEQRLIAGFMGEFLDDRKDFKRIDNFYENFIKKSENVKPWLKELTSGMYHTEKAWHFRGGGYANTVKEEGWKEFGKHLKIAAEHLKKAHSLKPENPEAASKLIAISMGGGTKEPVRFWFDKAVAAELDHEAAYRAILWAYRPRWGGSHEKMLSFGRECIETGQYDTIVPSMMIEAIKDIKSETSFARIKEMGLYDVLHEVLKEYEKNDGIRYRPFDSVNTFKALHFCYAYELEKFSHVRKLFKLYGDSVYDRAIFKKYDVDFKMSLSLAFAMSGDASGLISKIHKELTWEGFEPGKKPWRSDKELDLIIQDLEDAKALTQEEESKFYFDKLTQVTQLEKAFNTGNWVELKFTKGLPTWKNYGGNWDIIDENTIQASTLDNQRQYLSSEAFFKPPFIVQLEVESIKSNWRGRHLQAGLILGRMFGPKTGRTFWADGLRKRSGVGIPNELPSGINLKNKSKKNTITVYAWNGHHEIYLNNNQDYFIEADPKFEPLRVSLGIMPWYPISGVVKYSNFKIKKLDYGTAPGTESINERIAYFNMRVEKDPNPYVYEKLVTSYFTAKEYSNALNTLKERDSKWASWWNPYYTCTVLEHQGVYEKIPENFELALKRSKSSYAKGRALNGYAWFSSTCKEKKFRDPKKALKLALELNKMKTSKTIKPYHLSTLAAAYSINGSFDKAVELAEQAIKMTKDAKLIKGLTERIDLYKNKKIYISDPLAE
ncbi:MAG: hypothetical protein NE328_09670 [Lentisphaeraceae bacterium]|nr:hypothetical protein [Lentisphaeraceae bacterium]